MRILRRRGFETADSIRELLETDINTVLGRAELRDTDLAVDILASAAGGQMSVTVYHDYDADGIMACAVVMECLQKFGLQVHRYANSRSKGGYGMQKSGVDEILRDYPDTKIILTVDNGITAADAIEYAKSLGLKVVVTDHHEPGELLPSADALIDPKRKDECCLYRDYCGAGVAFLVMIALCRKLGCDEGIVLDTLDMVALATVADVVPMLGDNRALVKEGLRRINQKSRPMFRRLAEESKSGIVTAHSTIGYLYGPMINASARMGLDVGYIVEAFLTDDDAEITACIEKMRACNEERKKITAEQTELAYQAVFSMISKNDLPPVIVIYSERFDEGIIGLIAGRITNRFHRPSVVFADGADRGVLKASCRSIAAFPIHEVLNRMDADDLMLGHGGHAMAAGLSIVRENYGLFRKRIVDFGRHMLKPEDFKPKQAVDLTVRPDELTADEVRMLSGLEPFGEGFPPPLFELVDYNGGKALRFGKERQHLKVIADRLSVIFWNDTGKAVQAMAEKSCVGVPSINEWQGKVSVDFTADGSYYGISSTLLQCQNGELVEAVGLEDQFVYIEYEGKVHKRRNDAFGKSLLPFDAIAVSAKRSDLHCETCILHGRGNCDGREQGICEFYQNYHPFSAGTENDAQNRRFDYYRIKRTGLLKP